MAGSMSYVNFRCSYFQRQKSEYDVTASWVPCREHFVILSIPVCGVNVLYIARIVYLDRQLWVTVEKKNGTLKLT